MWRLTKANSQNELWHWANDEFGGFKSHSDQLSIATSKKPSVVNTTYIQYIYIYIKIKKNKDKEKQLFWNLVSCCFINNLQLTNSNVKLLQCYGISLTSHNLICTRMKNTPQSHNDSAHQRMLQKPSTPQVWNEAGTLASPSPMLKHKVVVYFPLPH